MALSAVLGHDVAQAHDQYGARDCGTDTPIVQDTMGSVEVDGFKIRVALFSQMSTNFQCMQDRSPTPPGPQMLDMHSQVW